MKLICCNQCGTLISSGNDTVIVEKDWFTGEKTWGYFSEKDGKTQRFVLCESCYDRLVSGFVLPVYQEDVTEF